MMIYSRSKLAIALSKVKVFSDPKIKLEQYAIPSEIASDLLWQMHMKGELAGKRIADLGCGTGILGIGALLMGADQVLFIDKDKDALSQAREGVSNIKRKGIFIQKDIENFSGTADAVIMNPPFGIKKTHADRIFLKKAMDTARIVYSYHKSESENFIKKLCKERGFYIAGIIHYEWPIKAIYNFHSKRIEKIQVGCWEMRKK